MFILQRFLYLFKEQKEWILFCLPQNKRPKEPAKENSFHANIIKILPNIIKCWLLISDWCCSIRTDADAYLLKNSLLTTSLNKYFQPSLVNKNTKIKLLYSAIKLDLKDLWVRKYESTPAPPPPPPAPPKKKKSYIKTNSYRWLFPSQWLKLKK